jgi:hypothetical protein
VVIERVRRRPWLLALPVVCGALVVALAVHRGEDPALAPSASSPTWVTAATDSPSTAMPAPAASTASRLATTGGRDPASADLQAAASVAIAFAEGFATYRWDDADGASRQRLRPYVTDALDRSLADGSSAAWLRQQSIQRHETTSATVERTTSEGYAPDGRLGMIVQLEVDVRSDQGSTTESQAYELFMIRQPDGWRVDEVRV